MEGATNFQHRRFVPAEHYRLRFRRAIMRAIQEKDKKKSERMELEAKIRFVDDMIFTRELEEETGIILT